MAQPAHSGGLGPVFDNLEQQLLGLSLEERAAAVVEVGTAAYADVTTTGRLHASVGRTVALSCLGDHRFGGVLERAGADWIVLGDDASGWLVRATAITGIEGLADRSLPEEARPVTARLSFSSALRSLDEVVVVRADGTRVGGRVGRVGADFLEIAHERRQVVVPFAAIVAVRSGR